jgi:hypothetical protein
VAILAPPGALRLQAQEPHPPSAEEQEQRAAAVKAAILFKIGSYCTRVAPPPAPAGETARVYRIGVIGDDATARAARQQLPRKAMGPLEVEVVDYELAALRRGEPCRCDLLYVAASTSDEDVTRLTALHRAEPTLLVAEREGFAAAGGSVQLFVNRVVRFEVNQAALKAQGLRASPQLLQVSQQAPRR